jgi:hypothetical protein
MHVGTALLVLEQGGVVMGRRTVEILTCDICGREVKGNEWTSICYPTLVHHLDDWGTEKRREIAMLKIDACDSCLDKMATLETDEGYHFKREFKWREVSE